MVDASTVLVVNFRKWQTETREREMCAIGASIVRGMNQ